METRNTGLEGRIRGAVTVCLICTALFVLAACPQATEPGAGEPEGEKAAAVPVEGVAFDFGEAGDAEGPSLTLNVGETRDLSPYLVFTPADATNKGVIWYIDEGKAISLDETGVLSTADRAAYEAAEEEARTAAVLVTTLDGNKQASAVVKVAFTAIPVESLTINNGEESLDLNAGDEADLAAAVFPVTANNYRLEWESGDETVVAVDGEGHITAQNVTANGSAVITLTAVEDGVEAPKTAEITVNVAKGVIDKKYDINTAADIAPAFAAIAEDTLDDDKAYTVTIKENISLTEAGHLITADPTNTTGFQGKTITITDNGAGKTISLGTSRIGAVITVGDSAAGSSDLNPENKVTVILTGSITIVGIAGTSDLPNNNSLVFVARNGVFELDGGAKLTGNTNNSGAGVMVNTAGKFYMKGGEISGNRAYNNLARGGGVFVNGEFVMSGGVIAGNKSIRKSGTNTTTAGRGGGVYVAASCTFTKTGGIIYGNDAEDTSLRNTSIYIISDTEEEQNAIGSAVFSLTGTKRREATLFGNDNLSTASDEGWIIP
jgi:hypothetical protein